MDFSLERYLHRIGIKKPQVNASGLFRLQEAQLSSIAFENIDPLLGVLPQLEPTALCEKILKHQRGGYCLELNGLLELALTALGFDFEPVLARVFNGKAEAGPRAHLVFLVKLDTDYWLVDAGFGGPSPKRPLLFTPDKIQHQGQQKFRIRQDPINQVMMVEKFHGGIWFALYGFDLAAIKFIDREAANLVCSTWNRSPFSQHLVLFRNTRYGRIHLHDQKYIETRNADTNIRLLKTRDEFKFVLTQDFGLALTADQIATLLERFSWSRCSEALFNIAQ